MEPFTRIVADVALLLEDDIDTDIIFPARFLLITEKAGLGQYAFYDKRHLKGMQQDFPIDPARGNNPAILIAGGNFGCGSSREQAVWALQDLGVRAIVAPSFGEIFEANCYRNGILPVRLVPDAIWTLVQPEQCGERLTIDLERCEISRLGMGIITFEIPGWRRQALLNGWDEVLTLIKSYSGEIERFERGRRTAAPWLFANG